MPRADGSILIKADVDVSEADKELGKLRKSIGKTEEEIEDLTEKKDAASEKAVFSAAELDAEKAKLEQMKKELEEIRSISKDTSFSEAARADAKEAIPGKRTEMSEQQTRVRMLQTEYNNLSDSVQRYDKKLTTAKAKLENQVEQAGELAGKINSVSRASQKMAKAQEEAQKSLNRFGLRLREVVRSALVFTLITQALAAFREWTGKVIRTNAEATQSIAELKAALLTLAQPLVNVVLPAFTSFVNMLTIALTAASRLMAAIFGKSYEEARKSAEALNDETEALEGVGSAASKAAGSLAGFDEINTIATEATAGTKLDYIAPDFSEIQKLPEALEEVITAIELKIKDLRYSWDKGEILKNKDAWIVVLSSILGAVIGGAFFGLPGGAIGLALGALISLTGLTFLEKGANPEQAKETLLIALGSILGAALGTIFAGFPGGAVGLLLGALVTLVALEFDKEGKSKWDQNDTLITVLSAILGAILGGVFGGIKGSVIGMLLGAGISFTAIKFAEGKYNKNAAEVSLRSVLMGMLGAIAGNMFGGPVGAGVGFLLGMTVSFTQAAFEGELHSLGSAQKAFTVALTTILGAVIGAMGFGVFGGIVGGVIGLTLGVAITLTLDKVDDSAVRKKFASGQLGIGGGMFGGEVSISKSLPALATGAVVPPNREFMAILGDNKKETEVVSPLSTMKQAVMEAIMESGGLGGGTVTVVVNLDGKEVARNTVKHVNDMTRQAGKPVLLF